MGQPLDNITVAITEHRYTKEFSTLFEKLGAKVYACPLLEEKPVEDREELRNFIRRIALGNLDAMIFLTGVGARFLAAEAESMGQKKEFIDALNKMTVVVRGPKPVTALRQMGVHVDLIPQTPTTEGVIEALADRDLNNQRVGIQLYGTPNPQLVSALESRGAAVTPVHVYDYGAVADPSAVKTLISKMDKGEIGVVAFTSAPQVRIFFEIASQQGLKLSFDKVVIASIGEVTNRALAEKGLKAAIVPQQSKMSTLAQAVGDYFAKRN